MFTYDTTLDPSASNTSHRQFLELVGDHRSVLDVGCSLGAMPRRLSECGFRGIGLEVDAALARKASFLSGVPVYTTLEEVAASEGPLGAVVMYDVFEHLYHPVAFVKALGALLAPGGVLVLETFRTDSPAFSRDGLGHEDVKPIEHPFMYRLDHIEALLRRAGFTPLRVQRPLGDDHARVRVAARRDGAAAGLALPIIGALPS